MSIEYVEPKYKIVKKDGWYHLYKYREGLGWWPEEVALTYWGAKHLLKKAIKKENTPDICMGYYTSDGKRIGLF